VSGSSAPSPCGAEDVALALFAGRVVFARLLRFILFGFRFRAQVEIIILFNFLIDQLKK
jgi:hypothetical protein